MLKSAMCGPAAKLDVVGCKMSRRRREDMRNGVEGDIVVWYPRCLRRDP